MVIEVAETRQRGTAQANGHPVHSISGNSCTLYNDVQRPTSIEFYYMDFDK